VNSRKVSRAKLNEGDLVRLGEVVLRVLPEQITGTVVMAPEDLVDLVPPAAAAGSTPGRARAMGVPPTEPLDPPAPSPARARPAARPSVAAGGAAPKPTPAAGASSLPARPLTVQVLSALWLASVVFYAGSGIVVAVRGVLPPPFGWVAIGAGFLLALVSAVMAYGLWALKPWGRFLQIGIAALGLLDCPMTLASATVLVYMLRKSTAVWFSGQDPRRLAAQDAVKLDLSAETTFAVTLIAMTALGAVLTGAGAWFGWRQP
jgi:hypothetical protein